MLGVFMLVVAINQLMWITFATSYPLLLISAFILGAFLLASGPLGFQYGAEITYPAPEGTSNGLLLLAGQVSGIAFIIGMDMLKSPSTGSMTLPLIILTGAMGTALLLATRLTESALVRNQ